MAKQLFLSNLEEAIQALAATGTGDVLAATSGRLRGLVLTNIAGAGVIVIKDGGAGGTTIFTHTTSAVAGDIVINFPGLGIKFNTDLHISTLTNITNVVAFVGTHVLEQDFS